MSNRRKSLALLFFALTYFNWGIAQPCAIEAGKEKIQNLEQTGHFEEALHLVESLKTCESLTAVQLIDLSVWEFQLQRHRFKNRKAHMALLRADSTMKAQGIPPDLNFHFFLAESYFLRRDTTNQMKAFSLIEKELENIRDTSSFTLGRYYLAQFGVLSSRGVYSKTQLYLQKTLSAFEQSKEVPPYYFGYVLRSLGNLNRSVGDFDKSISFYQRELDLYSGIYEANNFKIAVCNYNLGGAYYEKLEYQTALNHYLATRKVWEKVYTADNTYMRNLNEAIGDLYWELGDAEQAIKYFNYSVSEEKKRNNDKSESIILQGDSSIQKGNYDAALNHYQEAYRWREKTYGANHMLTGACKNFVARAISSSGDIDASLDAYQEAINILVKEMTESSWYVNPTLDMTIQSHQYLLESLMAKGDLLQKRHDQNQQLKDLEAASETYETAILVLENMKNRQMSESSKLFWTKRTLSLFESSIETVYQLYELTGDKYYLVKAFDFSERSKSLLLLVSLLDHNPEAFANVPEEVLTRERKLKNEITEYLGKIESEEKRCAEVREKMITLWRDKLQSLQSEYDIFQSSIKNDYPEYFNLKYDLQIADLSEIQNQLLDTNTALVSYFVGTEKSYVFYLTPDEMSLRRLENSPLVLEQVGQLFSLLSSPPEGEEQPQQTYETYKTIAIVLYQQLLQPELSTRKANGEKQRLLIIPDGKLAYLSFESLLTQEVQQAKRDYQSLPYLLRDYAISYSPSASIRLLGEQHNIQHSKYFGFAPTYEQERQLTALRHSETEVQSANQLFRGKSWTGKQATEDLLKKHSAQAGILHLAMHGEVKDEDPLQSKLYFHASAQEDGLLHTYEIYNLNIPAQLVILSACNTASGRLVRGEGILSLERAFQYAGSKSLLSTHWTVDDAASATLTNYFLENLKSGETKDQALQSAKLHFLNTCSPDKAHPFYWSCFKLTGNTNSLSQAFPWRYIWFGLGLIFLVFTISYFNMNSGKP